MRKLTIEEKVFEAIGMFDQNEIVSSHDIALMAVSLYEDFPSFRQVSKALYRMRTGMKYPTLNWHKDDNYSWGFPF